MLDPIERKARSIAEMIDRLPTTCRQLLGDRWPAERDRLIAEITAHRRLHNFPGNLAAALDLAKQSAAAPLRQIYLLGAYAESVQAEPS